MQEDSIETTMVDGSMAVISNEGTLIEIYLVKDFILSVVPVLLDCKRSDLEHLLCDTQTVSLLKRFISDAQLKVVYFLKLISPAPVLADSSSVTSNEAQYSCHTEVYYSSEQSRWLALIKVNPVLDASISLPDQVQLLPLYSNGSTMNTSIYETLHSFVHHAVTPFFNAYINSTITDPNQAAMVNMGKHRDEKTLAQKKLAEFELSLLHLKQAVDIPDVHLAAHPAILSAIEMAHQKGKRATVDDVGDLVKDNTFLNSLQADVNEWVRSIRRITMIQYEPNSNSALLEINFWSSIERAVDKVETQLRSDPIGTLIATFIKRFMDEVLTMDILKAAKRFHATLSFSADTGLKEATEMIHKCNILLKDFPINHLVSATDIASLSLATEAILGHLNKKVRLTTYPLARLSVFIVALSNDLCENMKRLLEPRNLFMIDFAEFETLMEQCLKILNVCDKEFREVVTLKKRKDSGSDTVFACAPLKARLEFILGFRKKHQLLAVSISKVLSKTDNDSYTNTFSDVDAAYDCIRHVNILDVSNEVTRELQQAEKEYNERIVNVENLIISSLRDRLAAATNAAGMFRVFSHFNILFVRPRIRGAVKEYQTQLIENVKLDIQKLMDKFNDEQAQSRNYKICKIRDMSPICARVYWQKQIERQLDGYMKRVEDVLGNDWEHYAEGQQLKSQTVGFKNRLDSRAIVDRWLKDAMQKDWWIQAPIYRTYLNRSEGNIWELSVYFDDKFINLFKEIRGLTWLNFTIPFNFNQVATISKNVYPYIVSLMESIRTYRQVVAILKYDGSGISSLVSSYHDCVRNLILEGAPFNCQTVMRSFLKPGEVTQFSLHVESMAVAVINFQEKVVLALSYRSKVQECLENIKTVDYDESHFSDILQSVQAIIDKLNLQEFTNLNVWASKLDDRIQGLLLARLTDALDDWIRAFEFNEDELADVAKSKYGKIGITRLTLVIQLKNQTMLANPPVEAIRSVWYSDLHKWLGIVYNLVRVRCGQPPRNLADAHNETYRELLARIPDNKLQKAYSTIDGLILKANEYVKSWLKFQSLWDLETSHVIQLLGDDLLKWRKVINDIRQSRSTFDVKDSCRLFGYLKVDFGIVQEKISGKYHSWLKEVVHRFAEKVHTEFRVFYSTISRSRSDLERAPDFDSGSIAEIVNTITLLEDIRRRVLTGFYSNIKAYQSYQSILERHRYPFPDSWVYIDALNGEWDAFQHIFKKKSDEFDNLKCKYIFRPIAYYYAVDLQKEISTEIGILEQKTVAVISQWNEQKPVHGGIKPNIALACLKDFEAKFGLLLTESEQLAKASNALQISPSETSAINMSIEEVRELKSVWMALGNLWNIIDEIRDITWASAVPRKIRMQLEGIVSNAKNLPSRTRQYAAFEYLQDFLKKCIKTNSILAELKGDFLKDRHWKGLLKIVAPHSNQLLSQLSVGDFWNFDLTRHHDAIADIVKTAQGEMALQEFIQQVDDYWKSYSLELINYQSKCRLITNWNDIFSKCGEHLNNLISMKTSSYYKIFQEDACHWEEKLNRVHLLFDIWIDVQRRWVYLEGIFYGSSDIKNLLPSESNRFQIINNEFMSILKRVYKSPLVMDVIAIPNIQKLLERLQELLSRTQKSLGEYLERERAVFPRFYFLGDEDLLEIIGNSKDVMKIQKHISKLFAGISSVLLNEGTSAIVGMQSREGEIVHFLSEIDFQKRINEWLSELENAMQISLATKLDELLIELSSITNNRSRFTIEMLIDLIQRYPAQILLLAMQIVFTNMMESAIDSADIEKVPDLWIKDLLELLTTVIFVELDSKSRKVCEKLITELVHQQEVVRILFDKQIKQTGDFSWQYFMRFYHQKHEENILNRVKIRVANSFFTYGLEYLGIVDSIVQTPLTDKCYLGLTQALASRSGGSPFGPGKLMFISQFIVCLAGTGKTETVKALGASLGRSVLVFCCDEHFDVHALGRIFIGLCQVGFWACFDEFNRLEESMLSAVSQQIQVIQDGLKHFADSETQITDIELLGKRIGLKPETAIFVTMNPGYAGRSTLPDNLKKLFRSMSMTKPDKELIAQVMMYAQGFKSAGQLANKIVSLFNLCEEQLSKQDHYDFGLRALKSVLCCAGRLKRDLKESEQSILIESIMEAIVPKLIDDDIFLLKSLIRGYFGETISEKEDLHEFKKSVKHISEEENLVLCDQWMEKTVQLFQIHRIHHGIMLVGDAGSGKTTVLRVVAKSLQKMDDIETVIYVIDPKALSKEDIYGKLDSTTRSWSDGLFTGFIRKILNNNRGESFKRHWIVFDGDVDPEWIENLNSVLDDNKLLTLPNGERLAIPSNVKIVFEVESLKFATLATVSRCGMVWFSNETVLPFMVIQKFLTTREESDTSGNKKTYSITKELKPFFVEGGLVYKMLNFAETAFYADHAMDFTWMRALNILFAYVERIENDIVEYNDLHPDFPLSYHQAEIYTKRKFLLALLWSFVGDCCLEVRVAFCKRLRDEITYELPNGDLFDYDAQIASNEWVSWSSRVPTVDLETHMIVQPDLVIPTTDTLRHEDIIYMLLSCNSNVILCGPAGSGKTMSLLSAIRKLPEMEVININFSSSTSPELLLKLLESHCEYRKTVNGTILSPRNGKRLVVFCDEINLPAYDKYGSQRIISFLRQIIERGGFWQQSSKLWVDLDRVLFVGACNPPTDPGRQVLSNRFLRHISLIYIDHPGEQSLKQIYGSFFKALFKIFPHLRSFSSTIANASVDFFKSQQNRFTQDMQPHYVYSPRELTRWVRGIYEVVRNVDNLDLEQLLVVWSHEAIRLFADRLVESDERKWTNDLVDDVIRNHFPTVPIQKLLKRPILFSDWLSKDYRRVDTSDLREFVKARLKIFSEEELEALSIVLFEDILDHILRIDRVFHQPQGHQLLIGLSGTGKTTFVRFAAWMNGISIFEVRAHRSYTPSDFDNDLRSVLKRVGCKGEKICFLLDEANIMDPCFLERMNTLLANAEIPGLFEADEYAALLLQCKEASAREGLDIGGPDELQKWFSERVMRNLHVVITMNPPVDGELSKKAISSPALFNRCVLDWFGDWSVDSNLEVAAELIRNEDLNVFKGSSMLNGVSEQLDVAKFVAETFIAIHASVQKLTLKKRKVAGFDFCVTPKHLIDFITKFKELLHEKRSNLEDQQRHLNAGLQKLTASLEQIEAMRHELATKRTELDSKTQAANEKLKNMVADQKDVEQRKAKTLVIQEGLDRQQTDIETRKTVVMKELGEAEPAVVDAKKSVSNIKKQHLTEVRSMGNPPSAVKMALESVTTMLTGKPITGSDSWKQVQQIMRRDDFIASIVNFNTEEMMPDSIIELMVKDYISNPDFNYETVNRASKACGPLVQWAIAQVQYSSILRRVGPLRKEVRDLEQSAVETETQLHKLNQQLLELEERIVRYQEEYGVLISEIQALKGENERVYKKLERSVTLVGSLDSERRRWEIQSRSFDNDIITSTGDAIIGAAFITYAGLFDQKDRDQLLNEWTQLLTVKQISFRPEISLTSFLSTPNERFRWQVSGLPSDELFVENACILKCSNRYPLIIDPSGQAVEFLKNELKEKLTVTSFLDGGYKKQLETCLRFGTPILIEDADFYDPLLNPLLNREVQRNGGRILIRLYSDNSPPIDFSPSFRLYLATRDTSWQFSPDVCSRVTFVNFTITRESLQSQCLAKILLQDRPDVDEKRRVLTKAQGEFRSRLYALEQALLQSISDAQGNLLESDGEGSILSTLETLKTEVKDVTEKMEDLGKVVDEVKAVISVYNPLAEAAGAIYFCLEKQLPLMDRFYQFSLNFFIHNVFQPSILLNFDNTKSMTERVQILVQTMYRHAYQKVSPSLLQKDRLVFALLLAYTTFNKNVDESAFDYVIGFSRFYECNTDELDMNISQDKKQQLALLISSVKVCADLSSHWKHHANEWELFMTEKHAENSVPHFFKECDQVNAELYRVAIVKALRPDRLRPSLQRLVNNALGPENVSFDANKIDWVGIVKSEVRPNTPLLFCSSSGYDASFKVEHIADAAGESLVSIALGSSEGFAIAEDAIQKAAISGRWIFLKNVHLGSKWLATLEKKLFTMKFNENFRLFMTLEMVDTFPKNLLLTSRIFMFEPTEGLRSGLISNLKDVPDEVVNVGPIEKERVLFLVSFLHTCLVERSRFLPIGWTKSYEFNDADFAAAVQTIDQWMNSAAQQKTNISPSKIPWKALRGVLLECVYGSRLDNDYDQLILKSLIDHCFNERVFDLGYELVSNVKSSSSPDGIKMESFLNWATNLPEQLPLSWLYLPEDIDMVMSIRSGSFLLEKIRRSFLDIDDFEKVYVEEHQNEDNAWKQILQPLVSQLARQLPDLTSFKSPATASNDNFITRVMNRELETAKTLLTRIRSDLNELNGILSDGRVWSNRTRSLRKSLLNASIPSEWISYSFPKTINLQVWLADVVARLKQLQEFKSDHKTWTISLGLLFMPESFLTATRQSNAEQQHVSLEEMNELVVIHPGLASRCSFFLSGLWSQSIDWKGGEFRPGSAADNAVGPLEVQWMRTKDCHDLSKKKKLAQVPLYTTSDRTWMICKIWVPISKELDGVLYLRGGALIANAYRPEMN